MKGRACSVACALVLLGCGAPAPPPGTGGTSQQLGQCGRGLVVIGTDYQSTNVSLVGVGGEVLSSSFVSSASEDTGLSAPLSGDVVTASAALTGAEVVLIDRYPASVLTWVDVESAAVRGQLNVSTGFAANPQDYLSVAQDKAYVSRLETNKSPGEQAFDGGGDLLIVDPRGPVITGRIDLSEAMNDAPGYLPRAGRMKRLGDRLFVLLSGYSADFTDSASSRVVTIDIGTDSISGVTVLTDMHGCSALALEPRFRLDGAVVEQPRLAVACSGKFGGTSAPSLAESGVVVLSTAGALAQETARYSAEAVAGQPIGASIEFVPGLDDSLLVTVLGAFGSSTGPDVTDALVELNTASGSARVVIRSQSLPFELGDVRCTGMLSGDGDGAACGACYLADAEAGLLRRLKVGDLVEPDGHIEVDSAIGLPPRMLGRF